MSWEEEEDWVDEEATEHQVQAALTAACGNPVIKAFYEPLLAAGKLLKVALEARTRKLLTILNAMAEPAYPGTLRFITVHLAGGSSEGPSFPVRRVRLDSQEPHSVLAPVGVGGTGGSARPIDLDLADSAMASDGATSRRRPRRRSKALDGPRNSAASPGA
jgi:hypothetical protein